MLGGMNEFSVSRLSCLLLLVALLSGCVSSTVIVHREPDVIEAIVEPAAQSHFEPIAGREAEVVATLRAAPPPASPEIVEGRNPVADQRALGARSFVLIGTAHFEPTDPEAWRKTVETGIEVGADHVVVYPDHIEDIEAQAPAQFLAMFYVRFKLLFGATFRNLTASERETLGVVGGVQIGSVVGETPASQANLLAGDYVLAVNGRSFRDRGEFQALLRDNAGKPVTLTLLRNEVSMDRVVRLGAMPVTPTP